MNTIIEIAPETVATRTNRTAESVRYLLEYYAQEQKRYAICGRILAEMGERLADSTGFSPSYFIQVTTTNREDLQLLMTLAPRWSKSPSEDGITYEAEVEGERFQIVAKKAALPATCKMVEEEYELPAVEAQPARKATRMVLKCDHAPVTAAQETEL